MGVNVSVAVEVCGPFPMSIPPDHHVLTNESLAIELDIVIWKFVFVRVGSQFLLTVPVHFYQLVRSISVDPSILG